MVALSSSISAKVSKIFCQEYNGYKRCSASQHSHPQNSTVSCNKNFVLTKCPPPPPREGQGVRQNTAGGGVCLSKGKVCVTSWGREISAIAKQA